MRLLFVSHSFPPADRPLSNVGGMQRVATELHNALDHHPEVALSSLLLRSSWRWTHLKSPLFFAKVWWEIARRTERQEIDAVLFSSMVTATLALPLRKKLEEHGVFTAAIAHGRDVTLPSLPYQRLVPYVFAALDAVLPVSRATGEACLERGLPERKLQVVPNGIQLDRFEGSGALRRMRQALSKALGEPLPEEGLVLCSVGRQVERKGFAWFVDEVMPLLPEDVHYLLAGEGPEAENIAAAIQRQGLEGRVRLLGRVSDEMLETLYRGADLFVMPNRPVPGDMEGFGVVMLEAGLCGLPAVAAGIEGIQDVISEGRNGHLVESGDAWGFSEAITAYHHNPQALRAASQRAARYVEDTFSWKAVAESYVQAMRALVYEDPALTDVLAKVPA